MARRAFIPVIASVFLALTPAFAYEEYITLSGDVRQATELYERGQYETSLSLLNPQTKDPAALFVIGRDYCMIAEFKKATQYLKRATIAAPQNSEYMDWLGRAYEKRAGDSNPLCATVFSKKARLAYERAVELNAKNADALSDLFRFYLGLPGLPGGNYAKAETVAEKMAAVDPEMARLAQWKLIQAMRATRNAEQPTAGSDI